MGTILANQKKYSTSKTGVNSNETQNVGVVDKKNGTSVPTALIANAPTGSISFVIAPLEITTETTQSIPAVPVTQPQEPTTCTSTP